MIPPRIIPRSLIAGALRVEQAKPGEPTCGRLIRLDGTHYRCKRKVYEDGQHDGIHDAFCEHGDGAVRW